MDGLRWFLLFFGLLVVLAVYFYSRRERERAAAREEQAALAAKQRVAPSLDGESLDEPVFGDDSVPAVVVEPDAHDAALSDDSGQPTADETDVRESEPQAQKIITMRVVARNQGAFAGDELALSLRGIGLRHGKFGIFHRYDGNDEDRVIFSAASLVEPGSFDLKNLKQQQIPGISLFMVLPGPIDGAQAFDLMMVAARALSQSLDAELLDESGSTLSIQRERYLREEIVQYQTSHLVA